MGIILRTSAAKGPAYFFLQTQVPTLRLLTHYENDFFLECFKASSAVYTLHYNSYISYASFLSRSKKDCPCHRYESNQDFLLGSRDMLITSDDEMFMFNWIELYSSL